MRIRLRKRKSIRATWLGRPFLNEVNGDRFSIHQQETTPFEIFRCVTASSRSKLALVLRHQTVPAVQFFACFLPRGVLDVTTWHIVNPLIVPNSRATSVRVSLTPSGGWEQDLRRVEGTRE